MQLIFESTQICFQVIYSGKPGGWLGKKFGWSGKGGIQKIIVQYLIWVYTFLSLPKTTPVFEIDEDEAARINKKQVCKQDVFRFFYRNFGSFPFPLPQRIPPPPSPIEAVAAAISVFMFGY